MFMREHVLDLYLVSKEVHTTTEQVLRVRWRHWEHFNRRRPQGFSSGNGNVLTFYLNNHSPWTFLQSAFDVWCVSFHFVVGIHFCSYLFVESCKKKKQKKKMQFRMSRMWCYFSAHSHAHSQSREKLKAGRDRPPPCPVLSLTPHWGGTRPSPRLSRLRQTLLT